MNTASSADAQYEELKALGDDYEALFLIIQDPSSNVPTSAYCNQVRAQHGLTMPVLIDDGSIMGTLGITGANHWNIVFGEGGEIVYKAKGGSTDSQAKAKVIQLLE